MSGRDDAGLTFKVGHISPDVAVQGIDDHFSIRWSGDFDPAVDKTGSRGGPFPGIVVADVLGLGEEIGQSAIVELLLTDRSSLEESFAGGVEGAVEEGEEGRGLGSEDLAIPLLDGAVDGDALVDSFNAGHDGYNDSSTRGYGSETGLEKIRKDFEV